MPTAELTRAWVDSDFRATLSEDDLALVPANPAGELLDDLEVTDPELPGVYNSWVPCFFSLEKTDSCCAY
ncbi:mersacidin/lichenicidin family type 2 lantibiotic [Curtobacterium sp. 9128]|uniref:mersacidin/lichenicidin family type 2 lantibiotic n=1 Tax=Curtobacterium sp. 9128 TaxID=1793722 RepID=UPI0011A2FF57|nr:mersacidin/lichenicidin family type 2 lantibiotic [Curtobacterium sp. 9128]